MSSSAVWLKDLFTPSSIRVVGGVVETGLWTLKRADGRTVTLVGMMHIGDSDYYNEVTRVVKECAVGGARVQYEQISRADDSTVARLTSQEQAELQELRDLSKASAASIMAEILGLTLQKTKVEYPEGARNIDYTDVELLRGLGIKTCRKMLDARRFEKMDPAALRKALKFVLGNYSVLRRLMLLLPISRRVQKVVLKRRNRLAVAGALNQLKSSDVVLVWGAAHLPGMSAELRSHGFKVTSRSWLKAAVLG